MSNIDQLLLADETVYFGTKKHIIIFLTPVILTAIAIGFFDPRNPLLVDLPLINNAFTHIVWFPTILAVWSWLTQGLMYITSHFVVTNKRVIMREGFFFRHATETRLSAIAEVKIDQTLVGQILNYGTITINSFGGSAEVFSLIAHPYSFQRRVSEKMEMAPK